MFGRWVMRESGLPPTERLVLLALGGRAAHDDRNGQIPGTCYPGQKLIAADTGLGVRTVNRTVRQLIAKGVVVAEGGGSSGHPFTYDLRGCCSVASDEGTPEDHTPTPQDPTLGTPQDPTLGTPERREGYATVAQGVRHSGTRGTPLWRTKGTNKGTIEGDQEEEQGPAAPKPARITPDWTPSDQARSWCREHALDDSEIDEAAEGFRDYWLQRTDVRSKKTTIGWDAAFRNRIRGSGRMDPHRSFKAKALPPLKPRRASKMREDDGTGRELLLKVARGDMPIEDLPLWDKQPEHIRESFRGLIEKMRNELKGEQAQLPLAGGAR
jgi:hypothetical protein